MFNISTEVASNASHIGF